MALPIAFASGPVEPATTIAGVTPLLPLFHLHELVLGMLLCQLCRQLDAAWWSAHGRKIAGITLLVVGGSSPFRFARARLPLEDGLLAPLFALAILGCSFIPASEAGWPGSPTMRLLGGASFSVYILQEPLFLLAVAGCARFGLAFGFSCGFGPASQRCGARRWIRRTRAGSLVASSRASQ